MGDDSNEDLITAGFFCLFFVPTHNLINNTNLPQVFLCHVYFGLLSVSAQHYVICCAGKYINNKHCDCLLSRDIQAI